MVSRGSFPQGKAAGLWCWQLTSVYAKLKNAWSYTSTPQYAFMAWCSIKKKKHRDNFTFTFWFMYVLLEKLDDHVGFLGHVSKLSEMLLFIL